MKISIPRTSDGCNFVAAYNSTIYRRQPSSYSFFVATGNGHICNCFNSKFSSDAIEP